MDLIELLKHTSDAVASAKAKEAVAQAAHAKMTERLAQAKAEYDAVEQAAKAEYGEANAAYQDAKAAVMHLRQQVMDALGGAFAPADSRVRMG